MISSDVIRGYNDTMILSLLIDAPSYGYEISKKIKSLTEGKYIMKETTLYSAFTRLENNGFIKSFVNNESLGNRRTYYMITESGLNYYYDKCQEWELTKEVVEKFIREEKENGNN
jgi:PadR family transcriptional regulator PadR